MVTGFISEFLWSEENNAAYFFTSELLFLVVGSKLVMIEGHKLQK